MFCKHFHYFIFIQSLLFLLGKGKTDTIIKSLLLSELKAANNQLRNAIIAKTPRIPLHWTLSLQSQQGWLKLLRVWNKAAYQQSVHKLNYNTLQQQRKKQFKERPVSTENELIHSHLTLQSLDEIWELPGAGNSPVL